jgi:hypothetical protein
MVSGHPNLVKINLYKNLIVIAAMFVHKTFASICLVA